MKPKLSIILSAIALIVLLIVQYYNISVTFQTKKEQFDNHYGAIIKQGLYEYESGATGYLSDSVFILFDNISEELVFQSGQVPGGLATDSLQQQIRASYNKILRDHTSPDAYLQDYLVKAGADPDFRSGFYIRELSLLDFDRIVPVYNDTTGQQPASLRNALQANTYAFEGNYFMIRYDYYIDFTHKTQIIYRDMVVTFILAAVTILVVLLIFSLTIRNMLIQKRLSDMKTDFINNMTHELKTPLSTIAVASSTLGDETLLKDKKKVLQISEMIKKQNKHLTELIDRILEISIWEKDQVKLKKKSIHVYEFIEDRINLFRIENTGKDLHIKSDYKLEKDFISLDEVHMTTVINNLLSNAVKYCEKKPEINIEVNLNMKLKIRIRDNGIGIRKEDQRHIFDKFYRAGKGDFKTVKGLGLGLYYVKQIVTAHHGEIFLHSLPGKGSTFTIEIPLNNEHTAG
jgi:signal transduction histidine kinase